MAGRYIINQTAGKRVIILDEDNDKVEGGYFDTNGTWVPFGGGGSNLQPILHLTLTHSPASGASELVYNDVPPYIEDGHLVNPTGPVTIARGESVSFDFLCIKQYGMFVVAGPSYFSSSDLVNCTVDTNETNWGVLITDPTKEASATVTLSHSVG